MSELRRITEFYHLVELVHSSAAGSVFRASDLRTGETVAVRLLSGVDDKSEAQREAFERTAQALRSLRHPGLPRTLDFGFTTAGTAFLVSEYCAGVTLDRAEIPAGASPDPALGVLLQVAETLEALAAHGLHHGNLRPDNVLVLAVPPGAAAGDDTRIKLLGLCSGAALATGDGDVAGPPQGDADLAEGRSRGTVALAMGRADRRALADLACHLLGARCDTSWAAPRVSLPAGLADLAGADALHTWLEGALCADGPAAPAETASTVFRRALGSRPPGALPGLPAATDRGDITLPIPFAGPRPAVEPPAAGQPAAVPPPAAPPPPAAATGAAGDDRARAAGPALRPAAPDLAAAPTVVIERASPPARPAAATATPPAARAPVSQPAAPAPVPGSARRRPGPLAAALAAAIALAALAAVGAGIFLFAHRDRGRPTSAVSAAAAPAAAAPLRAPRPAPPPSPAAAPRPPNPRLEQAAAALAAGDLEGARRALADAAAAPPAELSAADRERYQNLAAALAGATGEQVAKDLAGGFSAGSLGRLNAALAAAKGATGLPPAVQRDLERARRAVALAARLTRAQQRSPGSAEVLHAAAELQQALPAYGKAAAAREQAAAQLEARADAAVDAGQYDRAQAELDTLRAAWPDRPRLAERTARIGAQRQADAKLDSVLAAAARAEQANQPLQGLDLLAGATPGSRYAERFRQQRDRLAAVLARLDSAPPKVALRDGSKLEYDKDQPALVRLRVTDDFQVKSVECWARAEGGAYEPIPVSHLSGADYQAAVPVAVHGNKTVEIYVVASDLSGHQGTLGSSQQPLKLKRKSWFARVLGGKGET